MKRIKTFIVGAGASAELGFPTGKGLVEKIEEAARFDFSDDGRFESGDPTLYRAFELLPHPEKLRWNPSGLVDVASKIRQNMGLAPSIDYFLDSKKDLVGWSDVGKILIAKCILEAERSSRLYFDRNSSILSPSFADLPSNWLTELFKILAARPEINGFIEGLRSCRFITFNYDRTIEQFFHQAIKSYFQLDDVDADKLCKDSLNVVHIYGSLGEVTCSQPQSFGCSKDVNALVAGSQKIKTFTESIDEKNDVVRAQDWVRESDTVVFLGFGFLPLNLEVIFKGLNFPSKCRVLGTSLGIPEENLSIAKSILAYNWKGLNPRWLKFESVKCSELIWNHASYLGELDVRN